MKLLKKIVSSKIQCIAQHSLGRCCKFRSDGNIFGLFFADQRHLMMIEMHQGLLYLLQVCYVTQSLFVPVHCHAGSQQVHSAHPDCCIQLRHPQQLYWLFASYLQNQLLVGFAQVQCHLQSLRLLLWVLQMAMKCHNLGKLLQPKHQ